MNFAQRKYGFGQPSLRHYSTIGLLTKQDTSIFKPDYLFYNANNNFLTECHGAILTNKSFSNPNFVNKQHPNILAPSVAGLISFQREKPEATKEDSARACKTEESSQCKTETNDANDEENLLPRKKHRNRRRKKKSEANENKSKPKKRQKSKKTRRELDVKKQIDEKMRGKLLEDEPEQKIVINCVQNLKSLPKLVVNIVRSCPIQIEARDTFYAKLSTSDTSSSGYSVSPLSPARGRFRITSECDSEDSYIVFCDDAPHIAEESDTENDSDFQIDFADRADEAARSKKQVSFKVERELCTVHRMVTWRHAYQMARIGPWEQLARDRTRFECRIRQTECKLARVLAPDHRTKVYEARFSPPE